MRKHLAATAAAVAVAFTAGVAAPAGAETRSRPDPDPGCSQAAPLDVKRATFTYSDRAFKTKLRMGELSKKKTQVFSRFFVRQGDTITYEVFLVSAFRKGDLRTTGRWTDYDGGDGGRINRGLTGSWDVADDTVTFRLTKRLQGQRINAAAYSVAKGEDHGPPCGDYIVVDSLRRG